MAIDRATFSKEVEDLSSAVADLVDRLDTGELESLTVLSIKEHRMRLQAAQDAYEEWNAADGAGKRNASELKSLYMKAELDNRVQMAIVAVLVERLGQIPDVPDDGAGTIRSDDEPPQS
jgi:hypothetical protein